MRGGATGNYGQAMPLNGGVLLNLIEMNAIKSITHGRVTVEAIALNQGRTQQLWQVDVKDEQDRLLAHGEVRLQNLTV